MGTENLYCTNGIWQKVLLFCVVSRKVLASQQQRFYPGSGSGKWIRIQADQDPHRWLWPTLRTRQTVDDAPTVETSLTLFYSIATHIALSWCHVPRYFWPPVFYDSNQSRLLIPMLKGFHILSRFRRDIRVCKKASRCHWHSEVKQSSYVVSLTSRSRSQKHWI